MKKQHVIVLKTVSREFLIRDRRGTMPSYRAFDLCSSDEREHFTRAPGRSHALEVAKAYRDWSAKYAPAGLAVDGRVVIRPYRASASEE